MNGGHALQIIVERGRPTLYDSWSPHFGGMMPERTKPKPATHLELTIRYTVDARSANIADILENLEEGSRGDEGEKVPMPGGRAELVRIRTVPAPV